MIFNYFGDDDNPIVEVSLKANEKIRLESGAMVYMQDVALEGKTNSNKSGVGGLFKALGRALVTGESLFITTATGQTDNARIGIAPSVPGTIAKLTVGERQYRLNTGAFLACDDTVTYEVKSQNISNALFGGTGGLFIMETTGYGDLLVNAFSSMIELTVTPDRPLVIDNMHVVAWDSTLDYEIRPASGIIGFKSGEGLVNEFRGSGRVLVQTRNIYNLAMQIKPYIPTSNS